MAAADRTVFVVDDDDAVRDALCRLFQSVDFVTEAFDSAEKFIESYETDRSGCLIVDLRMPGMSGIELVDLLRERGSDLPVIVISGHSDAAIECRVREKRINAFFHKPFADEEFLAAVHEALRQ